MALERGRLVIIDTLISELSSSCSHHHHCTGPLYPAKNVEVGSAQALEQEIQVPWGTTTQWSPGDGVHSDELITRIENGDIPYLQGEALRPIEDFPTSTSSSKKLPVS